MDTDFICRRGALTKILCTPYEKYDWIIYASKYRGTIYLCEFYTSEKEQRHVNATTQERRVSSWGYKFEQYMVAGILKIIVYKFEIIFTSNIII